MTINNDSEQQYPDLRHNMTYCLTLHDTIWHASPSDATIRRECQEECRLLIVRVSGCMCVCLFMCVCCIIVKRITGRYDVGGWDERERSEWKRERMKKKREGTRKSERTRKKREITRENEKERERTRNEKGVASEQNQK